MGDWWYEARQGELGVLQTWIVYTNGVEEYIELTVTPSFHDGDYLTHETMEDAIYYATMLNKAEGLNPPLKKNDGQMELF